MPDTNVDTERGLALRGETRETQQVPLGRSWFFGIGINEYQQFSSLNNAVRDVEEIRDLLIKNYDIEPDPDPKNPLILRNQEATMEGIIAKLDWLTEQVKKDDKLIIYFSGHGFFDKKRELGYWIPYDAKKGNTANYIRNSTIRDYVKAIEARHTLLISDACFSGALFVRGVTRSDEAIQELEQRVSRWAICSGRHNEEVYDGDPGKHSPFAESIIDILSSNRLPKLNVAKLADRVVELTRANYHQLPEGNPLFGVGHEGGQYVFRLKVEAVEPANWIIIEEDASIDTIETTLDGLRRYVNNIGEGAPFVPEAQKNIVFLEELLAWRMAMHENTLLAYHGYDEKFPNGRYIKESIVAKRYLEAEQAWYTADKLNTLSAYQEYLLHYPEPYGKHRHEAQEKVGFIVEAQRENQIWKQATQTNTIDAYDTYLKKYPQGQYQDEAQSRLESLRKEKEQSKIAQFEREKREQERREREKANRLEEQRLKQQEEEVAWIRLNKQKSFFSLRAFLKKHPDGKYAQQVKNQLSVYWKDKWKNLQDKIEKKALWVLIFILAAWNGWFVIQALNNTVNKPEYGFVKAGGQTYKTLQIGKKTWLAENLNYEVEDSWCYDDNNSNCIAYGRLYTLEAAKHACQSLGPGWRLPADEEWTELARQYSITRPNDPVDENAAFEALAEKGRSGFNATFAGYRKRIGSFRIGRDIFIDVDKDYTGYYWSNAEGQDTVQAKGVSFSNLSKRFYHLSIEKNWANSCRCVKDTSFVSIDTTKNYNHLIEKDSTELLLSTPPKITYRFKRDELTVTISEGKAPFSLTLNRGGKEKYNKKLNTSGSEKITLTEFRNEPGQYEIRVSDVYGQTTTKTITIDPPHPSSTQKAENPVSRPPFNWSHLSITVRGGASYRIRSTFGNWNDWTVDGGGASYRIKSTFGNNWNDWTVDGGGGSYRIKTTFGGNNWNDWTVDGGGGSYRIKTTFGGNNWNDWTVDGKGASYRITSTFGNWNDWTIPNNLGASKGIQVAAIFPCLISAILFHKDGGLLAQ